MLNNRFLHQDQISLPPDHRSRLLLRQ
jgi:hypothetical protein